MKKIIIPIGLIGVIVLMLLANSVLSVQKDVPLDLTDNLVLSFEGTNGNGIATAEKNIPFDGSSSTVRKFIQSVTYDIQPKSNLSNGDSVIVTAKYDQEIANMAPFIKLNGLSKTYIVDGLQVIENGENGTVIDGFLIPESMDGNDEDRRLYVAYQKSLSEHSEQEEVTEQFWYSGTEPDREPKADKEFLKKEFNKTENEAYDQARAYGSDSSQQYQVKPIMENESLIGWKTVFKSEE